MSTETETYFNTRMHAIGCDTADKRKFAGVDAAGNPVDRITFTETDKGDVRIWYYRLDGNPYTYHPTKKDEQRTWAQPFYRDRLIVPWVGDDGKERKYTAPKGSHNCPYFTPQIIEAYKAKTKIPLLILTEGEFKAAAACNAGLHVVGIAGIQGWYDPDNNKRIHTDILDLIQVCQVEKLLLLTDADTLSIDYKPDKDLSQRPFSFFSSVKNYREAAMHYISTASNTPLRDVYFGHIDIKHLPKAKGLDDLLKHFDFKVDALVTALKSLSFNSDYFNIYNISDGLSKIIDHFGLSSPEKFYTTYSQFIGENEFRYKKTTYRWHEEEQQLSKVLHEDIQKFMRIGCDWFKLVNVPTKHGVLEEIKKWKVGEIQRDYERKYPGFLDEIIKYEAWCNKPAVFDEYKRVHDGCFNLFNPLKYQPAAGSIDNTIMFLKHLFKGEGNVIFKDGKYMECSKVGDPFTVALDYLTLMCKNPTQILPVMCLVSPENNTGKTTFLKWQRDILGSNATIIDNERFKQSFNGHYISKFLIGIDEGFLDVDKKSEKERLKKLATDDRQYMEFKGADVQEIDFYGKIIICSNDADNLMKIDEGEIRWFVVRVHPFTKEMPRLGDALRAEIPAWLHFLKHREVVHPNEGRAWFAPEHIKTEQLQIIIDKTRNRLDKVVDDFVIETLRTFEPFGCAEFRIDLKGLADTLNKNGYTKYKIDTTDLKNYLQDKKNMLPGAPERIKLPVNIDEANDNRIVYDNTRTARCYHFKACDWLTGKDKQREDEPEPTEAETTATQAVMEFNKKHLTTAADDNDPFGTEGTKYSKP